MSTKKRKWSNAEALEKIRQFDSDLQDVANEMCSEMVQDPNSSEIVEKLVRTVEAVRKCLAKLQKQDKQRKFRHKPEELENTFLNYSQYSFANQSLSQGRASSQEDMFSSQDLMDSLPVAQSTQRPSSYQKKSIIDSSVSYITRRRRVEEYRKTFGQWALELKCSISQLAGLMIHYENYVHARDVANVGWKIFSDTLCNDFNKVTPLEGIWIIEKLGISYAQYTELRLRLFDRIYLPPVHVIRSISYSMTPKLEVYNCGVRAQLADCLLQTLIEQLTIADQASFDDKIIVHFCYGLDGSGDQAQYNHVGGSSTKQIMSVNFAIHSICTPDQGTVWSSLEKGFNSPQNVRPLAVFPSKESDSLLREFMPWLDQ